MADFFIGRLMKYSIFINQKGLVEADPKANLHDGAVLNFLYEFCTDDSSKIEAKRITGEDGLRYSWINYGRINSEMPLLRWKSKAVYTAKFKHYESVGFIKTMREPDGKKYVAALPKLAKLFNPTNGSVYRDERAANTGKQPRSRALTNKNNKEQKIKEGKKSRREAGLTATAFSSKNFNSNNLPHLVETLVEEDKWPRELVVREAEKFFSYWQRPPPGASAPLWRLTKNFDPVTRFRSWMERINWRRPEKGDIVIINSEEKEN